MQAARRWIEQSLAGGHEVSAAVLASACFDGGTFRAVVRSGVAASEIENYEEGGMLSVGEAGDALARILDELAEMGATCAVVEDDMSERTDPAVARRSFPLAFIGDRIVSWSDLESGSGVAAAEAIRRGASGYPRNAFVVLRSGADLGLVDRCTLPKDFAGQVAGALLAVIVAAFDDESYLIWTGS
jgi:hypothetical protein